MIRVGTFNLNDLFDRISFHALITGSPKVHPTYRWRLSINRDLLPPLEDASVTEEGALLTEGEPPVRIEISPQGRVVRPKLPRHLEVLEAGIARLNADGHPWSWNP